MESSTRRIFEDVVQKIRLEIARGKLGPGQRFPTERSLAAQFRVSRGSIREGIRALELFGLVTVKRGRDGGVFTTPNCQEIARASFILLPPVEQYSFLEALEFRKIIEPKAAALAALRATDDHLNTLRKSLLAMEENADSVDIFAESNRLFHDTIAIATGNPYIWNFLAQLFATREVSFAIRQAVPIQRSLTRFFHTKIVEAITQKNVKEAEEWMEAHLSQIESDLRRGRELVDGASAPADRTLTRSQR